MSKIIAMYGSPGSGRSTFSAALAARLAKKQNVIVLSTNRIVPMLKVLVPSAEISQKLSVGGIFLRDAVLQEEVCQRIVFHPQCASLGFMGLATGDTPNTYNKIYRPDGIKALYSILLNLTDILIVDCMSNISPSSEPLGYAALKSADVSVKLLTPDIYGIEYDKAIFPILRDVSEQKHITVFGMCKPTSPIHETASVLSQKIENLLPCSAEIDELFNSGKLIVTAKTREGRTYLNSVEEIAKEIKI